MNRPRPPALTTFPPGTKDAPHLGEYALVLLLGPVGAGGKLAGMGGD